MATYTTNVTNPTNLTANETVTINSGAIVTITQSSWSAAGMGTLTINAGKLLIKNTSTTTGIKLTFNSSATTMTGGGTGVFETQGDWISIGTGTGSAGQTVNSWDTAKATVYATGTVTATNGSNAITGASTVWTAANGIVAGQTITITGVDYVIQTVNSSTSITLTTNYTGTTGSAEAYSISYLGDFVPAVWVETGSGTGVYEIYLNLSGGHTQVNHPTLSSVGAGNYGRFFTQFGNVITFGNGTNGKMPPSGANIRMPNIMVTYNGVYATTTPVRIDMNTGTILSDKTIFSRQKIDLSASDGCILNYIASIGISFDFSGNYGTHARVFSSGFVPNTDPTVASGVVIDANHADMELEDCAMWGQNSAGVMAFPSSDGFLYLTLKNTNVFYISSNLQNGGSSIGTTYATYGYFNVDGGIFSGTINISPNSTIENITYVDNLLLSEVNTTEKYAIKIFSDRADVSIKNIYVPDGGGNANGFMNFQDTRSVSLDGIDIQSSYYAIFIDNSFASSVTSFSIKNVFIKSGIYLIRNFPKAPITYIQNIKSDDYTWNTPSGTAVNTVIKGMPLSAAPAGAQDSFFAETFTGATTGNLTLNCYHKSESTALTITGGPLSNKTGNYYLYKNGDSLTYEWPHTIRGISSFVSAGTTITGTTTNLTIQYAIDTGSGYSAWKTLSGANLAAETVSATNGFKFKVKITCTADNTTNYISKVVMPTTVDQSVLYPTASGTLTLTGLQTGTEVHVYRASDGVQLASTEGTAGSTFSYVYDYFGSDTEVYITVLKVGYEWLRIDGQMLGENGLTIPVFQAIDRNYNNP